MPRGRGHDVDRALPEVLQELRVVQTGGQLFFAFLFSVAFTPVFQEADDTQRTLYLWTLGTVTAAMVVLVMPVAAHRASFGLGHRPAVLEIAHVAAAVGLLLLAVGVLLGMVLISSFVLPGAPVAWLPVGVAVILVVCWVIAPLWARWSAPGGTDGV